MNSLPPNTFKADLVAGKPLIGLWCNYAALPTVESLAHAGFDWLLLDMEHTPTDLQIVGSQLLALRGTPSAAVVRVPVADMGTIKRALDTGTTNLMVPNVRSAAEAADIVSWTRFPPQGLRGVAGSTRAGGYTRFKDYMARANDEIAVILQIESRQALGELEAICAVPGVDAVFIGPSDLAADLGHRGQPGHPEVQAAISQAIATARRVGRPIGILTVDGKGEPYLEQGATMVGVGSDLHLLVAAADALAARFATKR